uniref:Uncharacterized protein n=1 Tax=Candidatus Kentrum sp. LFY TaxID=2126342 RepID=A0A450V2V6_9GAMM|nr:MAG: hypothetical protein BECKLFY1418A_GA0070994_10935 [Candidatus Kentron sp. LFY]
MEESLESKETGKLTAETRLPPKYEQRRYDYRAEDLDATWRSFVSKQRSMSWHR